MTKPTLIMLCGIPGSGKTTYAKKFKNDYTIYLSSDSIREALYGDESIQGNPSEVFALMQNRAIDLLNKGYDVIYDATNITRKDRAGIIAKCPKFVQIECHIVWAPIETCIKRDAARERTVGKEVIDRMLKRFQAPYYDEGIDQIRVILPDDFNQQKYINDSMNAMKIPHDNPHHTLDIFDHCEEAYKYACKMNYDDDIKFAAKFHDIGKPYVKSFLDNKSHVSEIAHYYSHQNLSAWIAYGLNNSTVLRTWLICMHMEPFLNTKYYRQLPDYLKNYIDLLHKCDLAAH